MAGIARLRGCDVRPGDETCFPQKDENIRRHVFCSFLALVLRKELDRRLQEAGECFEWADIKQDLKTLQEVTIEDSGKTLALRTECVGTCGKVFKTVGVAVPPTIRALQVMSPSRARARQRKKVVPRTFLTNLSA